MILDCLVWIRELLFPLVNILILPPDKGFGPLPDDLLIDVLSRLPAYEVLKCRVVCKHWCALTSSRHFIELQGIRAPTIILGECHSSYLCVRTPRYFSFDGNAKVLQKLNPRSGILSPYYCPMLFYSFGGLIAYRGESLPDLANNRCYILFNPNTHEARFIRRPYDGKGFMAGAFYHPLACEHRFIWVRFVDDFYNSYYIYGSKTNIWRNISSTTMPFRPPHCMPPVILNRRLHWITCAEDWRREFSREHTVLVFRMDSEEFCTFPHPNLDFECRYSARYQLLMDLFEMDKKLCLGHLVPGANRMDIWILEDYTNWYWVKRHSIRIKKPHFSWVLISRGHDYKFARLKILSVQKDKLLINWYSSELYIWHLTRNTLHRIEDKHKSSKEENFYVCTTYTSSLATLDI